MSYNCSDCNAPYTVTGKYIPAFCDPCQVDRKLDIVEIITIDGSKRYKDVKEAEAALSILSCDVRLDLHNVLDLIPVETKLKYNDCCCVSFVGSTSQIRVQAAQEIKQRIQSGQIKFGALVFKRGNRRKPKEAHTYTAVGSKAWFNKCVKSNNNPIFMDDSDDHVNSVQHLLPHFNCILVNNSNVRKHLL